MRARPASAPAERSRLNGYGAVTSRIPGVAGPRPQLLRQDLRSDLLNADLLKAYPLPGWQIVLGEVLAAGRGYGRAPDRTSYASIPSLGR